ncbi:diacylglycerol kinase catalytic domain-containing protein [Apiospora arundinis]
MTKKIPNLAIEIRTFFMFPWLHKRVSDAVSKKIGPISFNKKARHEDALNTYSTKVMGRFECKNEGCTKKAWSSKMVAIVIRKYAEQRYDAVVFNQRCKSCNTLGTFRLDENSYIERVSYRLIKWSGLPQEQMPFEEKTGPPT